MNNQKTPEQLAEELTSLIKTTSDGFQKLMGSGIAQRTLLVLMREACSASIPSGKYSSKRKPTLNEVECIINGAKNLSKIHLVQPEESK